MGAFETGLVKAGANELQKTEEERKLHQFLAASLVDRLKSIDALVGALGVQPSAALVPSETMSTPSLPLPRALPTHQAQRVLHAIDEQNGLQSTSLEGRHDGGVIRMYAQLRLFPILRDRKMSIPSG